MIETLRWLGILTITAFRDRRDLALENLALRHQLGVLNKEGSPETRAERPNIWGRALSNLAPLAKGCASQKLDLHENNRLTGWYVTVM
jgi:hypothetical protein